MTDDKRAGVLAAETFWWCEECMIAVEVVGAHEFGCNVCAGCGSTAYLTDVDRDSLDVEIHPARKYWRRIRELELKNRELEAQLEAQLEKWPKTADGVRVHPGMAIWPPLNVSDEPPGPSELSVEPASIAKNIEDCYSSKEAWESAWTADNPAEADVVRNRLWRTLVRVTGVSGTLATVTLPGWSTGRFAEVSISEFPEAMRPHVKVGARFHARVNIDAEEAGALVFEDWEYDEAAEAAWKDKNNAIS